MGGAAQAGERSRSRCLVNSTPNPAVERDGLQAALAGSLAMLGRPTLSR